ncbi:hypothetical protein F7Q99_30740 [Streptomyces kaniharaensis]|uniref:Uncharacterized protein n=1 Tax=Streptomyces kaniharaensis TaxID=212423 RepID=A0A6N7KXP1_9ACTN|nr:hypothetical protein [Streptomyces kaniharaensis]MQS16456.1 hypothetical protein [Streptomyces kaniharaensis]
MPQLNRHGRLAKEYWSTYRPQALAQLGSPQEQEEYFYGLGLRVMEQIGELTDDLLLKLPLEQRALARASVRAQAQELVYGQEIWLPKEPGTEHREM